MDSCKKMDKCEGCPGLMSVVQQIDLAIKTGNCHWCGDKLKQFYDMGGLVLYSPGCGWTCSPDSGHADCKSECVNKEDDVIMNPEKNRLRRKNNVDFETVSDLLNELKTSVKTGLCPHCGAVLVVDADCDGWTHCPVCFWACGHNPG